MQNSQAGLFPSWGAGTTADRSGGGGALVPALDPETLNAGLRASQAYCMLSWPKLQGKWGQQAGGDAEGREGKLLEVPWPQVTASELRPDDLRTFSAGGRGSRQGLKRQ